MQRSAGASSLEEEVTRFDRFAHGLVRLEPYPRGVLRDSVERFAQRVQEHLDLAASSGPDGPGSPRPGTGSERLLAREHLRFRGSLDELRGLLAVVEADDHGGHRQALGQYGKILAEALRVHLNDERHRAPAGAFPPASGKHN